MIKEAKMTSQNNSMVHVIIEYIASIGEPTQRWPEMEFEKASYTRWAATEVLEYVLDNPDHTVIRSVEEFYQMCWDYSMLSLNESNFIFDIAKDTAGNILEILYAMV